MGVDPTAGGSHAPEVVRVLCGLAALGYDGIAAAVPVVCAQTGLNTAELVIQVGLPPGALALWEQGSFIPRTHHLLRLATILATHQPQRYGPLSCSGPTPACGPSIIDEEHDPTMTPPTAPTTPTSATRKAGSRRTPSYGGNTFRGRIFMTDGHQLATATRQPDGTITVHHLRHAPLRRLRFAVADRALLRGLVLLPTQIGDLAALLHLTTSSADTTATSPDQQPAQVDAPADQPANNEKTPARSPSLAGIAGANALLVVLRGLAGTLLVLLGAAALGGGTPGLASLLGAAVFALRPLVGARMVTRSYRGQAAALHGAEHQALNCLRQGLPLTDANIAASPTSSLQCDTSLHVIDQVVFTLAAATLELWLPHWPLAGQLAAGLALWVVARAIASELAMRKVDRRASGRGSLLGPLVRAGLRRQTQHTARPGGPEHREVAARALAPLLPAEQQALVGPFPSPVQTVTVPLAVPEAGP